MSSNNGFSFVSGALSAITSLKESDDIKEHELKKLKNLNFNQFQTLLEIITGQMKVKDPYFTIFKQKISIAEYGFNELEYVSNINSGIKADTIYHFIFNLTSEYFIFNALSYETTNDIIQKNKDQPYIFFTLNYGSDAKQSGHQAFIMISNIDKGVYLLDPNGRPEYFNNIIGFNVGYQLERIVKSYFDNLCEFYGYDYQYKFVDKWNHKQYVINKTFDNKYIGSGHCVILSFIIAHIISKTYLEPGEVYKILKQLWDDEILLIIKDYTLGAYSLVK